MNTLQLLTLIALTQAAGPGQGQPAPAQPLPFTRNWSATAPTYEQLTDHSTAIAAEVRRDATSSGNVGQRIAVSDPGADASDSQVVPASATEPLPVSTNTDRQPLALSRQGEGATSTGSTGREPPSLSGTVINIVSSLAIVLGLFFLVVWFLRRGSGTVGGALPSDVLQILGRSQLSPKQQLQLIRVGEKLVLVAVSAGGVQTLTEVTRADEVERLAAACEGTRSGSASDSFRQVLAQLGNQPAVGGFFGNSSNAQQSQGGRNV